MEKIKTKFEREFLKVAEKYGLDEDMVEDKIRDMLRKIEYDFLNFDLKDIKICNTGYGRITFYYLDKTDISNLEGWEDYYSSNVYRNTRRIDDLSSLREFIKQAKDRGYIIMDECYTKLTWNQFLNKINYKEVKKNGVVKWDSFWV